MTPPPTPSLHLLSVHLSNLPTPFPSSCMLPNSVSAPCCFSKVFVPFCSFFLLNQFHLKPAPSQPSTPPPSHSLSHLSLCVAASSQKCLILPLSRVQERSEEEGQPFSLSSFSSAVSLLRLPTFFKAALFFSFHLFFFPSSVWVSFFFSFFLSFLSGMLYCACSPRHWQTSQIPVPREFLGGELSLGFFSLYCFVSAPDA